MVRRVRDAHIAYEKKVFTMGSTHTAGQRKARKLGAPGARPLKSRPFSPSLRLYGGPFQANFIISCRRPFLRYVCHFMYKYM